MVERKLKVADIIQRAAAEFLEGESNRDALISITQVLVSDNIKNATIFISVLPESKEHQALEFTKRSLTDMRTYIKKHTRINPLPYLNVLLDIGEKNRQKIDSIERSLHKKD